MRNVLLKSTMLAMLSISPLPALAQEMTPSELALAYEEYANARISFSQVQAEGGDTTALVDAFITARQNLETICADLEVPEISACLEQFIAPEFRLPGDLEPLDIAGEEMAPVDPVLQEPDADAVSPETEEAEPIAQDTETLDTPTEVVPTEEPAPEIEPAPEVEVTAPAQTDAEETELTPEQIDAPIEQVEEGEPTEPMVEAAPDPEEVAPLLDSAKDEDSASAQEQTTENVVTLDMQEDDAPQSETAYPVEADTQPTAETSPPPTSDADAQATVAPSQVVSITQEKGERIKAPSKADAAAALSVPETATIVQENTTDFRVVLQFNNQIIVQNQDNTRLEQDSSDTYIERLRNGRTRETIERNDGTRVVTIYNRNGDILQRSRFTPDGEEYILVYLDEAYEEDLLAWRDPAWNLEPLQLDIPASEYILDADDADEEELVMFLDQPPVERVQRLYSINEVKRSARIRDMVRRLEVGGLTFQTGKANIPRDQIAGLTKVADAMYEMLQKNPAETFLIEGHTDAVGDDISNLELSDRRAETVAIVLSSVFGIPPENLATQGYGERYLKIRTLEAERLNRRVTIKRITPLISPVANR